MNDILFIISGIVVGLLIVWIKSYIKNKMKKTIRDNSFLYGASGVTCEKTPEAKEEFSWAKFKQGFFNIGNTVQWSKDIVSIFNLRKLIIVGVIVGVIFGYGYWKGLQGKPVYLDLRGKNEFIKLNEHYLHILPDGSAEVVDSDMKTVLKKITVKDVDSLRKLLRPYGFDCKPFFTVGGSIGKRGTKPEAGLGLQWAHWFKWNANSFITNVAIYPIGLGYQVTQNFDLLTGVGMGYEGDQRIYIGGKWRF